MKKRIKRIWVDTLLGGALPQCQSRLHEGDSYCPLGVLCEIAVAERIIKKLDQGYENDYYDGPRDNWKKQFLPMKVVRWAGLDDRNPVVRIDGTLYPLAVLNDVKGYTFPEFASLIEEQY